MLVTKVDPDKAAADEGIRSGMVIMKVGKKNVKNVHDFKRRSKGESLKKGVVLLVRSPQGGSHFVVLKD